MFGVRGTAYSLCVFYSGRVGGDGIVRVCIVCLSLPVSLSLSVSVSVCERE